MKAVYRSEYRDDAEMNLTHDEWDSLNQLCRFLAPFQRATDFFQGQRYPTLGGVSRYICQLYKFLQAAKAPRHWLLTVDQTVPEPNPLPGSPLWSSLCAEVQEMRNFIRDDLQQRWDPLSEEPDLLLGVAAATHPGHKTLDWLPAAAQDVIWVSVRQEMYNVAGLELEPAQEPAHMEVDEEEQKGADLEEKEQSAAKRQKVDHDLLWGNAEDEDAVAPVLPAAADPDALAKADLEEELRRYKAEVPIGFKSKDDPAEDPLVWWRQHEQQYPRVAKLAKKYLAIPCSSAPSERVFSATKLVVGRKRYRLLPMHVEEAVLTRHNATILKLH